MPRRIHPSRELDVQPVANRQGWVTVRLPVSALETVQLAYRRWYENCYGLPAAAEQEHPVHFLQDGHLPPATAEYQGDRYEWRVDRYGQEWRDAGAYMHQAAAADAARRSPDRWEAIGLAARDDTTRPAPQDDPPPHRAELERQAAQPRLRPDRLETTDQPGSYERARQSLRELMRDLETRGGFRGPAISPAEGEFVSEAAAPDIALPPTPQPGPGMDIADALAEAFNSK